MGPNVGYTYQINLPFDKTQDIFYWHFCIIIYVIGNDVSKTLVKEQRKVAGGKEKKYISNRTNQI